jgi:predicted Rossmann fold nucleotide-binding protein DprA/Smf involved in DNA uptake
MDLLTKIRGEIDVRLRELRPALDEYESLVSAAEDLDRQGVPTRPRRGTGTRGKGARGSSARNGAGPAQVEAAPRSASQRAIVAALEHGSHTVSELAVVTAMSGPAIRQGLRRLVVAGKVARAKREGKTAYTLSSPRR